MPSNCSISSCLSNYSQGNESVIFHRFPKDNTVRREWITACGQQDIINPNNARICSLHFKPSDYERNMKYELLRQPVPKNQRRLKAGAVPTIHLPAPEGTPEPGAEANSQENVVISIHGPGSQASEAPMQNAELGSGLCKMLNQSVQCSVPVQHDAPVVGTAADFEALQFQLRQVTAERDALRTENVERKMECITYVQEIAKLRDDLRCVTTDAANTSRNNPRSLLSDSQVLHASDGKPVKRWNEEDISRALTLRSLSPKAYRFLREKWRLPLPSASTLNRWVAKLEVEPGILWSVINLLKCKSESMTEQDRVCALSFDECSISKRTSRDKVRGPHKSVQLVMLRGVIAPWKQIIFYQFDCPMTKDILFDLIVRVEAAGFPVVATVNDLGPTNVRLWNRLHVSPGKSSFTNPADQERQIYAFADAPHLLRLIRNNFLDYGFKMADGKLVNSECVREMIARSKGDLKVPHRLSHKHIRVRGANRRNVKLAAHLISERTGKSLKYFGERGLLHSKDWDRTSDFILLTDAWFDLFCARVMYDGNETRNAYGTDVENQNLIVSKMMEVIESMNVCGHQEKFRFQKGLLVSSQSLLKLFEMLRDKYGISSLMTCRLNQDGLEQFFGSIRKMGGLRDHPDPVSLQHRLRAHLLGAENSIIRDNSKSEEACCGNSLPQASFTDKEANAMTDEGKLEEELNVSAMLFSSLSIGDQVKSSEDEFSNLAHLNNVEDMVEEEAKVYLGGYIAHRFPEHNLGCKVRKAEQQSTLLETFSWKESGLVQPSAEFLKKLGVLGRLFKGYHGGDTLKPGKGAINEFSQDICRYVDLPGEVVALYLQCRTFFRMRTLNRNMTAFHKTYRKMHRATR
ncbi:transposable element P transposase [Panulirus ornatus]|uniref:transposable element P transposase n=1 Tax=Panulirus ornatus TaxID=150431 RepID=UPI003A88DC4D